MPTYRILFEGKFEKTANAELELEGFFAARFFTADTEELAIFSASNEIYEELMKDFSLPDSSTVSLTVDKCEIFPDDCIREIKGFTFF